MRAGIRHLGRLGPALFMMALVAGCTGFAGVYPDVPVTPEATPTPVPTPTGPRLRGWVLFRDRPVSAAELRAFDLASGAGVPLSARSTPARLVLQQRARNVTTDSMGRFNLALPALAPGQVVKLVATMGGRTWTCFFDAAGRSTGGGTARYALLATTGDTSVRLTPAGTAVTQVLEGLFKLALRLPVDQRGAALARLLGRAEALVPNVEQALGRALTSEEQAVTVARTTSRTPPVLRALTLAGLDKALAAEVATELRTLTGNLSSAAPATGTYFPLGPGDFPIGTFSITPEGTYTWVAPDGTTLTGNVKPPLPGAPASPAATGTPETPAPNPSAAPTSSPSGSPAPANLDADPGEEGALASGSLTVTDGTLRDPTASEGVAP